MPSLLNAINIAYRGLEHTQQQISVASQNITNADREGYTRKTFRSDYITGNFGTVPVGGDILSALNPFLLKGVVNDTVDVGMKSAIAEFLDVYVRRTGNVASDFSLSSTLNDFFTHLDLLATTPENRAQKSQTIADAEVIALYLRDMTSTIQGQRTEVELEIAKSIDRVNDSLAIINDLNDKIIRSSGQDSMTLAEFEDQRALQIQKLSEEIDVTFYLDGRNRMQIYHPAGQPMLLSSDLPLSFDPVATLAVGVEWVSGGINPIFSSGGVDLTLAIKGGRLGGLIELRDNILVSEQAKFDEYANVLMDTMNSVLNAGASRPPREQLIGDTGFALADPFAGTGIVRIAITNGSGAVQSFTDFDISGFADINALINDPAGIDAIAGLSAVLSADGELIITSDDPTLGISMNEMTSDVGAGNQGFSDFFGLNDLFRSTGGGATNIRVAQYLLDDSDHLALGQLNSGAGLAVFDTGITVGDVRTIEGLSTSVDSSLLFSAAGDFSAQNVSIRTYAESIMSRAAILAAISQNEVDAAEIIRQQGADFMNNVTGVNIDEETATLIELESHYQASAQVIAIVRGLLEELIAMMR